MYHPHLEKYPRVNVDAVLPVTARLRPLQYPIGTRWAIYSADCGISEPGYLDYLSTSATLQTLDRGLTARISPCGARWKVLDQPGLGGLTD
jgi:hypothetical protein